MTIFSRCLLAKSTGESAAEVLEVVNDALRAIPVEEFITEAARNGPFGMSLSVQCPAGTNRQVALQVTVTSTVLRNGETVEVDVPNQEIVIVGSCDTDGEGGKAELLGGMTITKTLGVSARRLVLLRDLHREAGDPTAHARSARRRRYCV